MDRTLLGFLAGVPAALALMLFVVFTYLYRQSRAGYFRAWQIGWGAYCVSYAVFLWFLLTSIPQLYSPLLWISKVAFAASVVAVFISSRLMDQRFHWKPADFAVMAVLTVWISATVGISATTRAPVLLWERIPADPEIGFCALLAVSAYRFLRYSMKAQSFGYRLMSFGVIFWALMLSMRQFDFGFLQAFGGAQHFLGPLPQTALGIAMLTVLYENERRSVQENLLAFSHLEVDFSRVLSPDELSPSMNKLLSRLCTLARNDRALLYILDPFRKVLPSAQTGFDEKFMEQLDWQVGQSMRSLLKINQSTSASQLQNFQLETLKLQADPKLVRLGELLEKEGVHSVAVLAIESPDRDLGVLLLPQKGSNRLGGSQKNLILSLALQLGASLEKYAMLHESQRRTKEFELLTELGQVVASRLDQESVLTAIHRELSRLIDTETFYVAFVDEDKVRFEFETIEGELQPKIERPVAYGFTEHIVRTGEPLLIHSDLERLRDKLGIASITRPARCFCGVPIFLGGRAVGVMAAMHYTREFVYSQRDLELLQTAARQLAVAIENARLFAQEQRRARHLAFLNNISKMAISSQDSEKMLAEIVSQIQENFNFDHIGVGMIDFNAKEIEIKAEAGRTARAVGKRIPLGVGIMGKVARTGEAALEQGGGDHLLGIIPDSRSVFCIPVKYGDSLMGVLNIESRRENAFVAEEIMILKTLADLLATALHNTFIYQKMEQQSITDPLTGIKTRRYFDEALHSEFKRSIRSGRPFCVVVIDLDKFKEVNDGMGHLEGDLVLARIGRLLDQKVRQSNIVARFGGDEFVILMPETGMEQATILSERLRLWIATDPMLNERHVTGSFGVAEFPLHGATVEEIFRAADEGMYISKRAGGNKVSGVEPARENLEQSQKKQVVHSQVNELLRRDQQVTTEDILAMMSRVGQSATPEERPALLMETLRSITRAIEGRENNSTGHGDSVSSYAQAMARELGFSEAELSELAYAAQIHDVGKIIVPEKILNKAGSLSFDEYQLMKSHASEGARMLAMVEGSERMQQFVRHHQERFDGAGYPEGLKGEAIPLGARIIAVAEAYVNMIAEHPYAHSKTPAEAMIELERASGTQFDGMLVRVLLKQLKGKNAARA